MIVSFRHSGLKAFFLTGSKAGIRPDHAVKLKLLLFRLDSARKPEDMNAAGWHLHPLRGKLEGHWSVRVNGNWRLTFRFDGTDATVVYYMDYH